MAALPENDRIAGPFIAVAGQTDFPADFPLIKAEGLRVRRERAGVVDILSGADLVVIDSSDDGFTCRLTSPAVAGDRCWVFSRLPAARLRQHTPNGAVRSPTLESDAEEFQAQLQERARDAAQALTLPPGAAGGEVAWATGDGERFMTIGADGRPRAVVRPDDFNALGALQKDGRNLYDEAERAALRQALGQASPAEAQAPVLTPAADDAGRTMTPETTLIFYGAAARELSEELPFGQFLGVRGAPGHHWNDADHTPLLNAAIDKLLTVNSQKGGTIRLPSGRLNLGVVQPILDDGVWIKGVAGGGRAGVGSAIKLRPGAGDLFTWGAAGGAGYQLQGGGLEDVYIEGDTAGAILRTGRCVVTNRTRFHVVNRVTFSCAPGGYRTYGSLCNQVRSSVFDQMRAAQSIEFVGDAANRTDALALENCFIGAAHAGSGVRGAGILWQGYAHSLRIKGVQIVNPPWGILANDGGLSAANDVMRPHFLRAFGLEIDFASEECVRFEHFRDFEMHGGYMHSMGLTQCVSALEHMVGGQNRNGQLRLIGGNFSNGGNFGQIYLNCNDSLVQGAAIQPPSAPNLNGVYVGPNSQKAKIKGCGIGEVHVYANPANTTGVRVAGGAKKTSVTDNDFYNCANPVVDGTGVAGEVFTDANKSWGA